MSLRVTVSGGGGDFEIAKECVRSVRMTTDIPLNSDARTKDVGSTLILKGKILSAVDGDRNVTVEVIQGGIMERKYTFPNAFVVDYQEHFGDVEGTGTFTLMLKQKKDKLNNVAVEGGYPAV